MNSLLSLSASLMFLLAFPGGPLPVLGWVCLVPLGVALTRSRTQREAAWLCALFASISWTGAIWWLAGTLSSAADVNQAASWVVIGLFALYSSGPYVVYGVLQHRFKFFDRRAGRFRAALILTVLVSWYPHLLPGSLAHSQYQSPRMSQLLEIGGVPLLLFIITWVNWEVAHGLMLNRKKGSRKTSLIGATLIVLLVASYGAFRISVLNSNEPGPTVRVLAVQPNIETDIVNRRLTGSLTPARLAEIVDEGLSKVLDESRRGLAAHPRVDVVVWPELPLAFSYSEQPRNRRTVKRAVEESGVPFVVCGYAYTSRPPRVSRVNGERTYFNSAHFLRKGEDPVVYHKQRLIPFGEYLPFEESMPWIRRLFPAVPFYRPGGEPGIFKLGAGVNLIPLTCYEAVFSRLARDAVELGGNVLINMVNDAWFGEGPGSEIHFALQVFRTIEFRIPMIRVSNSGISAFVQPTGEIINKTPLFVQRSDSIPLRVPDRRSFYAFAGDWFLYGASLWALLDLLVLNFVLALSPRAQD